MSKAKELKKSRKDGFAKFLSDFLPLIVFVTIFKSSDSEDPILLATLWMVIVTMFSLSASYLLTRKLAKMPLISAAILGIFGTITVFSGDDYFIKIKPTLLNLTFAAILLFGYFTKKPLISYLFGGELKLKNQEAWHRLSIRWAIFFIFLAIINPILLDSRFNFSDILIFGLTNFFAITVT